MHCARGLEMEVGLLQSWRQSYVVRSVKLTNERREKTTYVTERDGGLWNSDVRAGAGQGALPHGPLGPGV